MRDGSRFTDQEGWKTMQFAEETANRDPRLAQTIRIPGYSRITEDGGKYSYSTKKSGVDAKVTLTGYQMAKFVMPDNNASADKFDKSYNDIALFRYAEVLLNYAEAKAELGTLTADDWSLTIGALRRRAGITGGDLDNLPTVADPYLMEINPGITDPVLLEIRRERAVELAQEGLRYDDLMRWKYGDMIAEPYYGVYFPGPGVYDIDGDGTNDYYIYSGSKDKCSSTLAASRRFLHCSICPTRAKADADSSIHTPSRRATPRAATNACLRAASSLTCRTTLSCRPYRSTLQRHAT